MASPGSDLNSKYMRIDLPLCSGFGCRESVKQLSNLLLQKSRACNRLDVHGMHDIPTTPT